MKKGALSTSWCELEDRSRDRESDNQRLITRGTSRITASTHHYVSSQSATPPSTCWCCWTTSWPRGPTLWLSLWTSCFPTTRTTCWRIGRWCSRCWWRRSWWMFLILFGGSKYTTKRVVCIYQSHRRKKKKLAKKCAVWLCLWWDATSSSATSNYSSSQTENGSFAIIWVHVRIKHPLTNRSPKKASRCRYVRIQQLKTSRELRTL